MVPLPPGRKRRKTKFRDIGYQNRPERNVNTAQTGDLAASSRVAEVDWIAQFTDSEPVFSECEPPPPLNRATYPLVTQPGWRVTITPPNPEWPSQFNVIETRLTSLFSTAKPPVSYSSIEHIGSTSILNLHAKPNIDILIVFPTQAEVESALEAFAWELPSSPPFIKYTRVPNGGGIQGRESLKLYVPDTSPFRHTTPERSVYLINNHVSNHAGIVQIRCYRTVKHTLSSPDNADLLREYAHVKLELATRIFEDSITYSDMKNAVIRKILKRGGWTDTEVDEKERLSARTVYIDEPAF